MQHKLSKLLGRLAVPVVALSGAPALAETFTVTTTADTTDAALVDGTCADSSGACSLRAAVQQANAQSGSAPHTIVLAAENYKLTIAGALEDDAATGDLDVRTRIVIEGNGASITPADLNDRAFDVHQETQAGLVPDGASSLSNSLTLNGLAVRGFEITVDDESRTRQDYSGAAVRVTGADLVLENVRLTDNAVSGAASNGSASGGAVFNNGGTLVIKDSTLSSNEAARAGGAIESEGGLTSIFDSMLAGNFTGPAPGNGGALHLTGEGMVNVVGSTITGNAADREGGGLWNFATGTMTVTDSVLSNNFVSGEEANQGGGALFNQPGGDLTVLDSTIRNNFAIEGSASGGGILNLGDLVVENTVIRANRASRAGGGIETNNGNTRLTAVTLRENRAGDQPGNGGGMHVTAGADSRDACEVIYTQEISDSLIRGNRAAKEGGGLWNHVCSDMIVTDSIIEKNRAPVGADVFQKGPGVFTVDGEPVTPE